jgi:acetoin utilization deacetylase AcuC-like enzyme
MKIFFLTMAFVAVAASNILAQCDQKVIIVSSQTNQLNGTGDIQRSVDEITTIEYYQKEITVTPGYHTMNGSVTSVNCDWKTPFKNGKTVLKAVPESEQGKTMNLTITI